MTDRPSWMNQSGSTQPSKVMREQTKSYIKSPLPPVQTQPTPGYTTHPVVVVGVALMATLTMVTLYFWLAIWLFGRINPPDVSAFDVVLFGDYLTTARVGMALVAAAFLSALTWMIGGMLVED